MSDGFLGRWSRRKLEVGQGKAVQEAKPDPAPQLQPTLALGKPEIAPLQRPIAEVACSACPAEAAGQGPAEVPALTLEDVQALTPDSDYSRFAAADVLPEVKNAAMKKLFADPRYNVMDGLDVYTEDYSRPDPIPRALLRQLGSAKFLGLLDQEEERQEAAAQRARDVANNPTGQTVAQSQAVSQAVPEPPEHADLDLRLQQDHAASGEDPGRGPG